MRFDLQRYGHGARVEPCSKALWHVPSKGQGNADAGTGQPGTGRSAQSKVRMAQKEVGGLVEPALPVPAVYWRKRCSWFCLWQQIYLCLSQGIRWSLCRSEDAR